MARTSNRPRYNSPLNLPGAFQLFKPSRDIVIKNIWIFGPLYGVPLLFFLHSWLWSPPLAIPGNHLASHLDSFSSGWLFSPTANYTFSALIGFSIIWFLFALAIGTIAQIMSQAAQLEAVEDKPLHFYRLWQVVKELGWRMLGLYLLVGLYVFVGLILFIVPGLIMLRRYYLASYVMLDKKCSVKEAMERSSAMSKPYSKSVWGIIGVMFLIALVSVVPYIGSLVAFVLSLLYSVAPAMRYQQLKKLT
jgi:hypothetical protein